MNATGAACEMAIVGEWGNDSTVGAAHEAAAEALGATVQVFQTSGQHLPLTMDHQLHSCTGFDMAEQLCQELRIGIEGVDLRFDAGQYNDRKLFTYPSASLTFNVPLNNRLAYGAEVFDRYEDFRVALRVRLMPSITGRKSTPFGVLHAIGLRVDVPTGISEINTLQERFFCLLGHASRKGFTVLASDIRAIEDFDWLRAQPDLLFQGDVLSIALSLEYIQQWLAVTGPGWRTFRLGDSNPARALAIE